MVWDSPGTNVACLVRAPIRGASAGVTQECRTRQDRRGNTDSPRAETNGSRPASCKCCQLSLEVAGPSCGRSLVEGKRWTLVLSCEEGRNHPTFRLIACIFRMTTVVTRLATVNGNREPRSNAWLKLGSSRQ